MSDDNNGALFKNNRKETDKHPDYTGNATIDGIEYWVSAWIKEPSGKSGGKWMSLAFKPKVDSRKPVAPPKQPSIDDDIPF